MPKYVCLGVPFYIGERHAERTEVEKLKNSGIAAEIGAAWVDVEPGFSADAEAVTAVNRAIIEALRAYPGHVPIVFAGDCMSSLGMMKALEVQKPSLLWYDSHGDFNTPETTPSGFLGGMPLAMLVGRGDLSYMRGIDLAPMPERDVIISDARDLDPDEEVALAGSAVCHYTDLNALLTAPLPQKPIYLHLDTDVVDPEEMPGMNYPAPGGPGVAETAATVERVARDGDVIALSFSLWNDAIAPDDRSLNGTLAFVRALVKGQRA